MGAEGMDDVFEVHRAFTTGFVGLGRAETEQVLDSFFVVAKYEQCDHGEFRTKRLVLDRYDAIAEAIRTGVPYQTVLDPQLGHGPRHPSPETHHA